jgi:hypothetical protein
MAAAWRRSDWQWLKMWLRREEGESGHRLAIGGENNDNRPAIAWLKA